MGLVDNWALHFSTFKKAINFALQYISELGNCGRMSLELDDAELL